MITSELYDRIKYHPMRQKSAGTEIPAFIGIDSEADETGKPFLFTFSDGRHCTPEKLLSVLYRYYLKCDMAVFNLKYDAGAFIYDMPPGEKTAIETPETIEREKVYRDKETGDIYKWDYTAYTWIPGKLELWEKNYTTWMYKNDRGKMCVVRVDYIPHKFLKFTWSKKKVIRFWDIQQFYESSLNTAAMKYLDAEKIKIETKTFTAAYRKKNLKQIIKYGLLDAKLTGQLGDYLLSKVNDFGIRATSLYSTASLSFQYFQDNGEIIGIKRFWKHYPESVKMAMDSYEGGKFEVTARGAFTGNEYDIVSAYPYETANLIDITFSQVKFNKKYEKNAVYGFLRVKIETYEDLYLPCGIMLNNTRVYAIGSYYTTITKNEYDYLKELGVKVTICSATWIFVDEPSYPYRDRVNTLFELKKEYKGKDKMIYQLIKICLNGFYGKAAQCIKDYTDHYNAGVAFNPFYASVITANCRIRVSKVQNEFKKSCYAVHTDSVMGNFSLPENQLGKNLGQWEKIFPQKVPGNMIACGCYQIGGEGAFKGFDQPIKEILHDGTKIFENWPDTLKKFSNCKFIPYDSVQVESWVEAVSKGHFDKINLFQNKQKKIDLNADIKRIWRKDDFKARDFLTGLYHSKPRIITMDSPPINWSE